MSITIDRPKVMLHYIMPPNTSGPNTSMERIEASWLKEYFLFGHLVQDERPGKFFNIRLLRKLIKQIRSFQPDIIHISGLQLAGFYAVLAAKMARCSNVVTTVHGSSVDAIGFNRGVKLLFRYMIEPLTMYLSSGVYTVCGEMAGKFGIGRRKNFIGVIHNPAPIIRVEEYDPADFRAEIGAGDDDVVVVCVGRMYYDKGISFVIEAISEGLNEKAIYVFVGDGPFCPIIERSLNEQIVKGRVHVLGKRNDIFRILAGSDVFLFATLHENLSNALLEACAMGLAIIATSVGGNLEVIDDGHNGILIHPGSSKAITEAVDRLCENEEEREFLGEAARATAENNFSQRIIYGQLRNVYDHLMDHEVGV